MSELDDALLSLKTRIDQAQQQRERALARAEVAQSEVDDGLRVLRDEYSLESLEAAEAAVAREQEKLVVQLQDLERRVSELESDNE